MMWSGSRRAFYLGLSVLSILGGVLANKTITIDGQDTSIKYTTVNNGDLNATWVTVQRSEDGCDTPQRLTSRLGDYMTFTFTGIGISVVGTTGVKQGIINFTLDGKNITNFDRGRSELMCDQVLFQQFDLPLQQHTVVATLVGKKLNLQTDQIDGVLSVQRVKYNVPGSDGSSTPVGAIVGGIIGAVVLIGICGAVYYFWYRKRHPSNHNKRNNGMFWDHDDIDGDHAKHTGPNIVATPFEWDGPSKHLNVGGGPQYGGVEGEQGPGSPHHHHDHLAVTQPLLGVPPTSSPPWSASAHTTSFSGSNSNNTLNNLNPGPPGQGPRTHSSGGSSAERRRSAATLVAANPDAGRGEKNPAMFAMEPMGGRRYDGPGGPPVAGGSGVPQRPTSGVDDTQLVDRIAQRLADIMTERVGVAGSDAPPSYVGEDGELYGGPPPPPPPPPPPTSSVSPPVAASATSPGPSSAYPPISSQSPQYAQSPISPPTGSLQPPTPPANAQRFGPRPRPSGSVSGGPAGLGRSASREQRQSQQPPYQGSS